MIATLRTLEAMVLRNTREITVSGGGEPLLHPRVSELLTYLASIRQVHRRLYTHGGLLERFGPAIAESFDYVRISIDAGDAEVYSLLHGTSQEAFHKLFASARDLINAGTSLGLSMVVTRDNAQTVLPLIERCAEYNIRYVFLKPLMEGLWRVPLPTLAQIDRVGAVEVQIRDANYVNSRIEAMPQSVASIAATLTADNYIFPCCHLTTSDWRIAGVGDHLDCEWDLRHTAVATAYSSVPHACRVHDAWHAFQDERRRQPQIAEIATLLAKCIGHPVTDVAKAIASELIARNLRTIGITGPSSVGKTTVAAEIQNRLGALGVSCTLLSADDFLLQEQRGSDTYRRDSTTPLHPDHYAFSDLADALESLRGGNSVSWIGYERGRGWMRDVCTSPAAIHLVEGLFLDSAHATDSVDFDLLLLLEAPKEAIADWRRARDEAFRQKLNAKFRTKIETEEEIAKTMRAYADYEREPIRAHRIVISVDGNHNVGSVNSD